MLSVIVLTKNEQDRIKACLESVKGMGEIIMLDNGSNDKTLEIAKNYTDKIFISKDLDFANLRNIGMEKAKEKWVLYLDSDERVSINLRQEIERVIKLGNFSALAISRRNIIFGKEVRYGSFWPDWVIRLLKKESFIKWTGAVHEQPQFDGKLGYSKNSLLHLTHRDLDQVVFKSLEWSKIDARLRLEAKHPKMSGWRFIRILYSELYYQLIVRKGLIGGTVGIIDSILQSFSTFMSYVRLWQLQQQKPLNEVYKDIDKNLIDNNFKFP